MLIENGSGHQPSPLRVLLGEFDMGCPVAPFLSSGSLKPSKPSDSKGFRQSTPYPAESFSGCFKLALGHFNSQ